MQRGNNAYAGTTVGFFTLSVQGLQHLDRPALGRRVQCYAGDEQYQFRVCQDPGPQAGDENSYCHLVCRLQKTAEDYVDVELLRTKEWAAQHIGAGNRCYLDLPEQGLEGYALVLALKECPPLEAGPGRLITGWFRHSRAKVFDLKLASESKPLGVTATHLIWSVDRWAWVSVIQLVGGERVKTLAGTTVVEWIKRREKLEPVYNIEVEGDHCYRVGQQGLLVHNTSSPADPCRNQSPVLTPGQTRRWFRQNWLYLRRSDVDLPARIIEFPVISSIKANVIHQSSAGSNSTPGINDLVTDRLYILFEGDFGGNGQITNDNILMNQPSGPRRIIAGRHQRVGPVSSSPPTAAGSSPSSRFSAGHVLARAFGGSGRAPLNVWSGQGINRVQPGLVNATSGSSQDGRGNIFPSLGSAETRKGQIEGQIVQTLGATNGCEICLRITFHYSSPTPGPGDTDLPDSPNYPWRPLYLWFQWWVNGIAQITGDSRGERINNV